LAWEGEKAGKILESGIGQIGRTLGFTVSGSSRGENTGDLPHSVPRQGEERKRPKPRKGKAITGRGRAFHEQKYLRAGQEETFFHILWF